MGLQFKEATPEILMDWKLKCVFEMPNDDISTAQAFTFAKSNNDEQKKRDGNQVNILSYFTI